MIIFLNFILFLGIMYVQVGQMKKLVNKVSIEYAAIKEGQDLLSDSFSEELFNDHLSLIEKQQIAGSLKTLEDEYAKLVASDTMGVKVSASYNAYQTFLNKVSRNNEVKLDTKSSTDKLSEWGVKLLNQDFDGLQAAIDAETKTLDGSYQKYVAELPKPEPVAAPASSPSSSVEGYSYVTVSIGRGKFGVHLIKMPLSSVKVKTVSANKDTCKDNCPTKSLADYVKDNKAIAGMNGSYFCPPDYSSCEGKVNSYDFAFFNSNEDKWLNSKALDWNKTGLMTFNGRNPSFYKESTSYNDSGVDAGISNYPSLVDDGKVVVNSGDLSAYQKDTKGVRGAIGYNSKNLFLAIINNATVIDAAYVMKELGADYSLNLDGGGSSAMYIGGKYVVGPGRSLPNAVVLTN